MSDNKNEQIDQGYMTAQETEVSYPSLYHVVLLNDDYTTMDFVVKVIERVFNHSSQEAMKIMMEIHLKGKGIAGTYTRDIAKTKAEKVMHLAFRENFPLKCILEKV